MVNQIPFRTSKSETSGQVQRHQTHPSPPSLLPLRFHTLTNPSFPPTRPYRFSSSSLSCAYKSLNAQTLCFHIYAKPPGCHPKNSTASLGYAQRLSRKSISFILLQPLAASWLSFSPSCPLFSTTCSLLCQKQGGGGGGGRTRIRPAFSNNLLQRQNAGVGARDHPVRGHASVAEGTSGDSQNPARVPVGDRMSRCYLLREELETTYEVDSFKSSDVCLFAFLASPLASASRANSLIAFPRLTEQLPVIFALSASNPPGMSRFFATCAAATHCPRFLKPLQAVSASLPVRPLIFAAIAVL